MAEVHGDHDERFEGVRAALERNLPEGEELGASIAVDLDGKTVVDIWGGFRDTARTTPWTGDTIVNVWSTTKTVTSLAALTLIERGQLDVRARGRVLAGVRPERQGRDRGVPPDVAHLGRIRLGAALRARGHVRPGRRDGPAGRSDSLVGTGHGIGYLALNQGHLVGEVVRRVSGKPLKWFVAEEVAGPLGAEFQIGARNVDWRRIADVAVVRPGAVKAQQASSLWSQPLIPRR